MGTGNTIALASVVIAAIAVGLSYVSAQQAARSQAAAELRAAKAEDVTALLGEKETVAFAALKLQKSGLPTDPDERVLMLGAITTACVFTSSDRARALLYDVLHRHRDAGRSEIE